MIKELYEYSPHAHSTIIEAPLAVSVTRCVLRRCEENEAR
jgi:hypothetical protein